MINIDSLKKELVGKDIIDKFRDGHPNISGNKVIFDTYPDKSRMKSLYLYNYDAKKIFFDSVHTGKRQLYMLDFKL